MNAKSIMTVAACVLTSLGSSAAEENTVARELNWESYKNIRDFTERKDSDKNYLTVPWKETVLDGLIAGQKQDKPILLWLYFGDGRGHC